MNKRKPVKPVIIAGTIALAIALLGWLSYIYIKNSTTNYAQETAKPLEAALIEAGANKMCDTGDSGRGADNRAPNYGVVFETDLTRDKAIEMINNTSSTNGYKLNGAASAYPNILPYYDHTSHQNTYSDLKSGSVLLGISLYDGGANLSCPNTKVTYDSNHTAIKLDLSLPEYK